MYSASNEREPTSRRSRKRQRLQSKESNQKDDGDTTDTITDENLKGYKTFTPYHVRY